MKVSEKAGLTITRNKMSNWENGKTTLHPQLDRFLLLSLIDVLHKYRGIKTLAEANELLEKGDYRALDNEEIAAIEKGWLLHPPSVTTQERERVSPPPIAKTGEAGPGSAPPPPLLVGRDSDLHFLKSKLSLAGQAYIGARTLIAVHGWPGVGKTALVSALMHDADIQHIFCDGVLWLSVGEQPDLPAKMAVWLRTLGAAEMPYACSMEESRGQLAALLCSRRMLLILDDVWEAEHAVPFLAGGRNCATLITTRCPDVALSLAPTAADSYRLNVLKDDDSLALLRQLAPSAVKAHSRECLMLVQDLEGLPLALQAAGRLLNIEANRGFGVTELFHELHDGVRLLDAPAPSDRIDLATGNIPALYTLVANSLDYLDSAARRCYISLGDVATLSALFDLTDMKSVWQMDDPGRVVRLLVDRGLLEYVPGAECYRMHSLLAVSARSLSRLGAPL